jgi:hypothetical protein
VTLREVIMSHYKRRKRLREEGRLDDDLPHWRRDDLHADPSDNEGEPIHDAAGQLERLLLEGNPLSELLAEGNPRTDPRSIQGRSRSATTAAANVRNQSCRNERFSGAV